MNIENHDNQVMKAAAHFLELYDEEMKAGKVTTNAIYEWWIATKDQYPDLSYEEVEHFILNS